MGGKKKQHGIQGHSFINARECHMAGLQLESVSQQKSFSLSHAYCVNTSGIRAIFFKTGVACCKYLMEFDRASSQTPHGPKKA